MLRCRVNELHDTCVVWLCEVRVVRRCFGFRSKYLPDDRDSEYAAHCFSYLLYILPIEDVDVLRTSSAYYTACTILSRVFMGDLSNRHVADVPAYLWVWWIKCDIILAERRWILSCVWIHTGNPRINSRFNWRVHWIFMSLLCRCSGKKSSIGKLKSTWDVYCMEEQ